MARVLLGIRGMDNDGSVAVVARALGALDGVQKVEANPDEQATVEYDPSVVTVMDLIRTLRREGFLAGME